MNDLVLYKTEGATATITLNLPDQRNAISDIEMIEALLGNPAFMALVPRRLARIAAVMAQQEGLQLLASDLPLSHGRMRERTRSRIASCASRYPMRKTCWPL